MNRRLCFTGDLSVIVGSFDLRVKGRGWLVTYCEVLTPAAPVTFSKLPGLIINGYFGIGKNINRVETFLRWIKVTGTY
ncbi:MAG: hypothetical protein BroJett011_60750 [Chloroflexota bacterium]|nr:MAG: hypothetical protein BroJett011_60750 [Chloroflexota bacterium]